MIRWYKKTSNTYLTEWFPLKMGMLGFRLVEGGIALPK
jgi:hypothetical protein